MALDPRQNDDRIGNRFSENYDFAAGAPVAASAAAVRGAFLQKVYLTLCAGIAIMMATGFQLMEQFLQGGVPWLRSIFSGWGFLGVFILYMGCAFAAGAVARVKGVNILVFGLFATVTGLLITPALLSAYSYGGHQVIWNALGLTALVFGGLTAYVLITRADFSFMGGFLTVALLSMLGLIVISLFFQSHLFSTLISVGIVALFALYVLYDTSQIMLHLGPDEWAAGALRLFIDFINMFLNILFLLTGGRRD